MATPSGEAKRVGADRVLAVLLELAEYPEGVTLEQLAGALDSPKPTMHRALGALKRAGLAAQLSRGTYVLGDEFVRLALRHQQRRPESESIVPALRALAETYGETAHYAVLDGEEVVYRAKVDPPRGSVRLTSEIGGRNPAHRTAVGKLLLAYEIGSRDELSERLGAGSLTSSTPNTITDLDRLWAELQRARELGYAVDDQENEVGVNCIALPVGMETVGVVTGAVSLSALSFRTPLATLIDSVDDIRSVVRSL